MGGSLELTGQPVPDQWETLSQKSRWTMTEEQHLILSSDFYVHTYTYVCTLTHMYFCTLMKMQVRMNLRDL